MDDLSRVGEARRVAVALAQAAGLSDEDSSRVSLVASEAATNLCKHALEGELLIRPLGEAGRCGVELLCIDRGPGISRLSACLRDGYSTTGTPGKGLGCIVRQSDEFDIHTAPDVGTVSLSRILAPRSEGVPELQFGVVCRPIRGEDVCGDAWAVHSMPERTRVLVVDGLGHGPAAQTAAQEAVRIFRENPDAVLDEVLQLAHAALRSTRGAAMLVVDFGGDEARCAGAGNISGVICQGTERQNMVSQPGTVGMQIRRIQTFRYRWSPGALLILHSDGLATHWNLEKHPGLAQHHPGVVAGALYRDYSRRRDDVTVIAFRGGEGP